jgi:hypothetical protein
MRAIRPARALPLAKSPLSGEDLSGASLRHSQYVFLFGEVFQFGFLLRRQSVSPRQFQQL